ncbi:hypothetical protein [Viridibacillus arvi]|uniref:hypothetical protein n=1 Tax=Viridibacillus arvi TaxID=263475 RepID=UPI00187B3A01|nr:hypothetical protein [Viridibacillus sp. JNUCC-6]QOV10478.1 hypothetical protein JNUCC6_18130 [Viridibacillus sp. JNUCC-6]
MQFLLKNPNYITDFIKESTEDFKQLLIDSPFRDLLASKYAIILIATQLANHVFDFQINVDEIRRCIVERDVMLADSRDIGKSAWNHMLEFVQQHQNQFICENSNNNSYEIVGRIKTTNAKF